MRKLLFFLILTFASHLNAQTICTRFSENIETNSTLGLDTKHFNVGDSVRIHAYKKRSDSHYFIIETKDYADIIVCTNIPFEVGEKNIKKLPNALSDESKNLISKLIKEKQKVREDRKRLETKNKALSGEIKGTLDDSYKIIDLQGEADALGKIEADDDVTIIGYKQNGTYDYKWALYSGKAVGVYTATKKNTITLSKEYNLSYIPSIDDPDVIKFIKNKKDDILQKKKEQKLQYRNVALRGNVKGILNTSILQSDNYTTNPFSSGDTVCVLGYSNKGEDFNYYAIYSEKGAGVFRASSPWYTFKNTNLIRCEDLPSVEDPEVISIIETKRSEADSIQAIKNSRLIEELNESKQNLINVLQKKAPVVVELDSWSSNSVGGIELSLNVTNCSNQTIKYITFQGYFLNSVGDKCRNEIGGGTVWKARGVGPIGPKPTTIDNFDERWEDCKASYTFDNTSFYSRVADTFFFSSITIQYMNGKTVTLSGKNLDSHIIY